MNVTFDIDNYTGPIDTLDSDLQSYFADQLGLPRSQVEVISSYAELGRRLAVKSARLFVEVRMFEVQRQQEQLVAAAASYPALEREVGLIGGVVVAGSINIRTADVIPPSPPTALQ